MTLYNSFRLFTARWTRFEFLPASIANLPVVGFWLWYALRARHLFFFSNVNPSIPLGGAFGESKSAILRLLPTGIVPAWILVRPQQPAQEILRQLEEAGIPFPLIAKPDIGERGFLVKKMNTPEELTAHLSLYPVPFILQEFLTLPKEGAVLFHRFPGADGRFDITSVCLKEFMRVRGDGKSSIRDLMEKDVRYLFHVERFQRNHPELLAMIPAPEEDVLLEPVGNHARGTMFISGNHLADDLMKQAFESHCRQIKGVYYGRFDLKYDSEEALRRGEFKVMELNGITSDPAHVYDPQHGGFRALRDFWQHWTIIYRLHRALKKEGVYPTPLSEVWKFGISYRQHLKVISEKSA
ncbi:MAG: hypothetical protein ACKOCO_08555 [Bacteroidota bacterium]